MPPPPRHSGSGRGASSGVCSEGRGVWGMSGVWGTGGPQCQAALAVLASLCRARPPPLGLDVETCRSFELQPLERSPSAADAGNGKPEAPSLSGFSPWLSPLPAKALASGAPEPRERTPAQDSGLGTSFSQCPGPSPARQAERREGDPGGTASPCTLPCDSAGTPWTAGLPGRGASGVLSFPRVSPLALQAICQGKGPWSEQETGDIQAQEETRLLGGVEISGFIRWSVRPFVCSLGERGPSPLVSQEETCVCS